MKIQRISGKTAHPSADWLIKPAAVIVWIAVLGGCALLYHNVRIDANMFAGVFAGDHIGVILFHPAEKSLCCCAGTEAMVIQQTTADTMKLIIQR